MNRRQAAAAMLLLRHNRTRRGREYWVHPINQTRREFGEFDKLYKDLRNFPDRFFVYFRMTTEQFDYILDKIHQRLFKPDTRFRKSLSPELKLVVCLRYVYTSFSINRVHQICWFLVVRGF